MVSDTLLSSVEKDPIKSKTMNLKRQLRKYLEARGITASQLAKKAGVPKQSLGGWLAGSNPRDVRQIKRVAEVLGTTIDHLMFGDGLEKDDKKTMELDALIGDGWIGGTFEVRFRRVKN